MKRTTVNRSIRYKYIFGVVLIGVLVLNGSMRAYARSVDEIQQEIQQKKSFNSQTLKKANRSA